MSFLSSTDDRCDRSWLRIDRRRSRRIELRHRDAFVRSAKLGTCHVTDLSAEGVGVLLVADPVQELATESVELVLGERPALRVTVQPVQRHVLGRGQVSVGLVLRDLTQPVLSELSRFLLEEAAEQDEAFERFFQAKDALVSRQLDHIARVLRLSAEAGAPLSVFDGRARLTTSLRVTSVDDEGFCAISTRGDELSPGRRYGLVAMGRGAVSAFRVGLRAANGSELRFALPTELVQSGFRSSARSPIPEDSGCSVRLRHPRTQSWLTRRVLDASSSGVSLEIDPTSDLLLPGDQLSQIELRFLGRCVKASGAVRSLSDAGDGLCGIELFDFGSAADHEAWTDFGFGLAHPRLEPDRETAARLGYQVLETSGYVELWSGGQDRATLAAEYAASWDGQSFAQGRVLTLLEKQQPVATIAVNQLYPKTWMMHHLGVDERARVDRTSFLSYARELFSGIAHEMQRAPDLDYLVMYMEADKGFNDFLYGEFARMYADPNLLQWSHNQVYRARTPRDVPEGPMDRLVRVAGEAELGLLADVYARSFRPIQRAAFELGAEALGGAGFARASLAHPSLRARETYVFAPAGRPVYALVCETGDERVNLFGLMNRCWLTELAPLGSQEASAARRTLLRRALRHFAQAGKRQFVLFESEHESAADPLAAGFTRISDGVCWLSRREVLPAWLSYVEDALSLSRAQLRRAA
ncbi:MAG TPA: hypothetical protein VFZ61_25295 [Polyangiales bacterium]